MITLLEAAAEVDHFGWNVAIGASVFVLLLVLLSVVRGVGSRRPHS